MASLADQAIRWHEGRLVLLDQRVLPNQVEFVECTRVGEAVDAIREMVVRGAPAIGVCAAYGVALAAREHFAVSPKDWIEHMEADLHALVQARPTAVNLKWAITRMRDVIQHTGPGDPEPVLLKAARKLHLEDVQANRALGEHGASLLKDDAVVLTHCNAGALATGGYGTALGVIRSAHAQHKIKTVYADETRPWFQGTRLTAWELLQDNIPVTVICDSAAASLMREQQPAWVIVGADRVARNGDVANKIGTYALALMAREHGVGFMVAAPTSSIDLEAASGAAIEIEERSQRELTEYHEVTLAPAKAEVWNPVFDITPAGLVTALVTEKGVVHAPCEEKILALLQG
ncbi:MAG: S-methyl-5-thioribose-1-phosphate isomerase [Proteobacteria bacterium]|nr:S-methyl-5-thioribose-1-phosphate isomerase [Pseudomonadota bacterium]